jgi:hypothetical protein
VNGALLVGAAAAVVFAAAVAYDPRLARWLASVVYSRAVAVEKGRVAYREARRAGWPN